MKSWNTIIQQTDVLKRMMSESLEIYDQALYFQRQAFFKTKAEGKIKTLSYIELYNLVKNTKCFVESTLCYTVKQEQIRLVCKNWNSFIKSVVAYNKAPEKFHSRPRIPKYLYKSKKYTNVYINHAKLRVGDRKKKNSFRLPNETTIIYYPPQIQKESIQQVVIQPYFGKVKINIRYNEDKTKKIKLNQKSAIGIDLGVKNLCAITSNDKPLSYIVKGGPIKSINQYYNKILLGYINEIRKCKNNKPTKRINLLSLKRNCKIDYILHCVAKKIVNMCIENDIGTIVIGHNKGWKQNVAMHNNNKKSFVQIPFNRLINIISDKATRYTNIRILLVEESYTSKCDHIIKETMCYHEKYAGVRRKRGKFISSTGKLINADINGAIGILRKGNVITDAQLSNLRDRGDVVSPKVFS